jgi:hypothetical protein
MRVRVILSTTADKFLQKIQELQKIISRVLQVQTPFCTIFSQSLNYKSYKSDKKNVPIASPRVILPPSLIFTHFRLVTRNKK